MFTADVEAAKRAEVLEAYQNRPKITEGEVPIAMHGPGVDMKVVQKKAELNKLVLTKDKLAEERKKEQEAYKARGGAATVSQAPVDYSQQRSDGALERWIKIHFVDFIVSEALQQISVLAVAVEKSATFQQTRKMADGKYATYEHTLRVGNEVVLLAEQEEASAGRAWEEPEEEERMGVGQVKDFVEVYKRTTKDWVNMQWWGLPLLTYGIFLWRAYWLYFSVFDHILSTYSLLFTSIALRVFFHLPLTLLLSVDVRMCRTPSGAGWQWSSSTRALCA